METFDFYAGVGLICQKNVSDNSVSASSPDAYITSKSCKTGKGAL